MEVTAVEWVLQYLKNVKPNEFCSIEKIKELLEQAKEKEKQQIIDAFERKHNYNSYLVRMAFLNQSSVGEEYYNDTYGKAN